MIHINDKITDNCSVNIQELIGKQFEYYKQDQFLFTNDVYGIVGICIEKALYVLTNFVEIRDYFGSNEDVGVFRFSSAEDGDIHSYVQGKEMIKMPVNAKIKKITVVNEHQQLFQNGIQTYDVELTRGIVFELDDGLEISFEKDIWLSEDITIKKGYNLIEEFSPTDTDGWDEGYEFVYKRNKTEFC